MSGRRGLQRLVVAVLAVTLGGCLSIVVTSGRRPNPEMLETELRVGASTEADVLRVLGPPDGRGRSLLPIGSTQRPMTMWAYAFMEGHVDLPTIRDIRAAQVYVYFDEGRLQGYMWFSSLPRR